MEKRLMEQRTAVQPEGGKCSAGCGWISVFHGWGTVKKEEEERLDRQGTLVTSSEMSISGGRDVSAQHGP